MEVLARIVLVVSALFSLFSVALGQAAEAEGADAIACSQLLILLFAFLAVLVNLR